MKLPRASAKKRARIEIIPLIDIIFFLLATFVMVSISMIQNQGILVKLPTAVTGAGQERSASLTITVMENGDLYLDKEKIKSGDLIARLTALKKTGSIDKVIINGDKLADFEDIVSVLDGVRKIGIEQVAIQTKSPSLQPSS